METMERYDELCRLCASYDAVKMDIFGQEGKNRQLVDKIQTCLPFKVSFPPFFSSLGSSFCFTSLECASYFDAGVGLVLLYPRVVLIRFRCCSFSVG